jgi:hypothetical protein
MILTRKITVTVSNVIWHYCELYFFHILQNV